SCSPCTPAHGSPSSPYTTLFRAGHVVAHRRARHTEIVPVDQGFGSHRLMMGHVVGDDCPQHLEPTILGVAHGHLLRLETTQRRDIFSLRPIWRSNVARANAGRPPA